MTNPGVTSPVEFMDAIEACLKDWYPQAGTIETFPGAFTFDEVVRHSKRAPAYFLAFLGANQKSMFNKETAVFDCRFAVVVMTVDSPTVKRHRSAGLLISDLGKRLLGQRFVHGQGISKPDKIKIENLYSAKNDRRDVHLMGISWNQEIPFVKRPEPEPEITEIFVSCVPQIGQLNEAYYEKVVEDVGE